MRRTRNLQKLADRILDQMWRAETHIVHGQGVRDDLVFALREIVECGEPFDEDQFDRDLKTVQSCDLRIANRIARRQTLAARLAVVEAHLAMKAQQTRTKHKNPDERDTERFVFQCPICDWVTIRQRRHQNGCTSCAQVGLPSGSRQALIPIRPARPGEHTAAKKFLPPADERTRTPEEAQLAEAYDAAWDEYVERLEKPIPPRAVPDEEWLETPSTLDGYTFRLSVDVDRFYEDETALFREPAALNWPHGRIRPRCRETNEGKRRGFSTGRRRWCLGLDTA